MESRLRIRKRPDATSPVVGYLKRGESAPYERSAGAWYAITLRDGTTGYVSQEWSRIVAGTRTAAGPARGNGAATGTPDASVPGVSPRQRVSDVLPARDPGVARRVIAGDGVESRLRIRKGPDATSPVVGYLKRGESARYERSVGAWYAITLKDGSTGYVSQEWSRIVADTRTTADAAAGHGASQPAQAAPGNGVRPPFEAIIVTVNVNGVDRGTPLVLRDNKGRFFVPLADFRSWGVAVPEGAIVRLQGTEHVGLDRVSGLEARFDEKRVALEVTVAAALLPKNLIDLRWRYRDELRPSQPSAFFNYALTIAGDDSFGSSRTQLTTEAGARMGKMLLYSSGAYVDETGNRGYTRLQTNLTHDDRDTLQRFIVGDFFTPVRELSASFPMGGLSFSKYYPMDPYFVQYPTLNVNAMASLPSQVEVRMDGNVIARRQVQPGPIDIVNITGYSGARNVQVVVRDAFGREQVVQQPYYFTDFALKQGLHDYSYNLGFVREDYGLKSNDYGKPAFSGFHRYGFTDQLTLGLRAEAREGMANVGPIATVLLPGAGIVGAGASVSNGAGSTGFASSLFYNYVAPKWSISANARHFSDDYRVLPDAAPTQTRNFATASLGYSPTGLGTISTSYTVTEQRGLESLNAWNVGYNVGVFDRRGSLTLSYTKYSGLVDDWTGSVVFRYFFDDDYSVAASAARSGSAKSQAVSFDKTVPVGEGFGFSIGPGRAELPGGTATLANAYAQYNGRYAALQARYQGSSNHDVTHGVAEVSIASGIGYVENRFFVSRPLTESFAIVKVGNVPDVPVRANGQFMGRTDEQGEVVVSPMLAFYDSYIAFDERAVPLDYVFTSSQLAVAPALRSGAFLTFDVKKNRAVLGRLEHEVLGRRVPIEFRTLTVTRGELVIDSFTGKAGEFYVEKLDPGEYRLAVENDPTCVATIRVPQTDEPIVDLGIVACEPSRR